MGALGYSLIGGGAATLFATVAAWWFRREAKQARKERDEAKARARECSAQIEGVTKRAEKAEAAYLNARKELAEALQRGADALANAQAAAGEARRQLVELARAGKGSPDVVEAVARVLDSALSHGVPNRPATEAGLAPGVARDGAHPPVRPATATRGAPSAKRPR